MKTLFFVLKMAFVITLTAWILQYNGSITIQLEDQAVRLSCAETCLAVLSTCTLLFLLGYGYFSITKGRRYRKALKKLQRFEQAIGFLTKGYAAFLIKDGDSTQEWVQKARSIIKDNDFILYLEAQALLTQGEQNVATTIFKKLCTQKYPMFGIVPLLNHNLLSATDTIDLLKNIIKDSPEERWAWQFLLEIMIDAKNLNETVDIFKKMQKIGISESFLKKFEAPVFLLQREQALQKGDHAKAIHFSQKAYSKDPKDENSVIAYVRDMCYQHKIPSALEILSKQWQYAPTMGLAEVFKESVVNAPEEEKIKWKNHLLNACTDAFIKDFLTKIS